MQTVRSFYKINISCMFIILVQNFWIPKLLLVLNQNRICTIHFCTDPNVRYVYLVERASSPNIHVHRTHADTHMRRKYVNEGIIGVNTAYFISPCWLWNCHSLEMFTCSCIVFVLDKTRFNMKSFHTDDIIP